MKYRKKPVVIDAVQWTGDNWPEIAAFHRGDAFNVTRTPDGNELNIATLEGVMVARPGDWVIRGVKGELYPCKPDIFEQTYEAVTE
jgi:hypothetical protein